MGASNFGALRSLIGNRLGLRTSGFVTAAGTDPAVSFVDVRNTEPPGGLSNAFVLFTTGANAGTVAPIADNRDGEISMITPPANVPQPGDGYEIFKRFNPSVVRDAVNYAIQQTYPLIFARFEQEVAEDPNTLEYSYPTLQPPGAPTAVAVAPGGGHTVQYQVVVRDASGDSLASGLSALLTTGAVPFNGSSYVVVSWIEVSNADQYLLLRAVDGGAMQLLATISSVEAQGLLQTYLDQGQDTAITYTPRTPNPPVVLEVRQVRRRVNPSIPGQIANTPPVYQELPGSLWEDLSDRIRVAYRTTNGMYLLFVGMCPLAQVSQDSDVPSSLLPDELLLAGALEYMYRQLIAGEAAGARKFYNDQITYWNQYYEKLKRQHALPQIPLETHPPRVRVVRAPFVNLGPIQSGGSN